MGLDKIRAPLKTPAWEAIFQNGHMIYMYVLTNVKTIRF